MPARVHVAPTKTNLLLLKKQVRFLEQGQELLERKRDLLTHLVLERLDQYRNLRAEVRELLTDTYHWLALTQMRTGSCAMKQASLGLRPAINVTVLPKLALGVEYPSVEVDLKPLEPVGLLGTDASFDETRRRLAATVVKLAHLGEVETALGRLLEEQRKAQKRVNALKYNIIPRYHSTIRYIESSLEEEERNTLFQIKVLRQNAQSRDA